VTVENIRRNIREEWNRAQEARGAADLLAENGYLLDAVSRLYCWILHSVRAILLCKELEPKTHEGVLRLFSLHFVKEGPFSPGEAHVFSRLMKYRLEADYASSYVFTAEDYGEFRRDGEALVQEIESYLKQRRWL
jgi:uncharacterized protein (UPF0332 family)